MLSIATRDLEVLQSVARYYTLTRGQINRLHFPTDSDGRVTRKRLRLLHEAGLINRTNMQVVNPTMGAPAYVYYPSADGVAFLRQELASESVEADYRNVCTMTPGWMHLYHWIEVTETHILLDHSAAAFPVARVMGWISEWDVANKDEKEPEKKFRLYTRLGQKLVCAPDAAFQLQKDEFRKVYYLEEDRDTTKSADRVAAQKCHGYAGLYEQRMHIHRHFPNTNVEKFSVLFVTPTARRRDALRAAFCQRPAPWLYKFAVKSDLTPENFLQRPVWHPCIGEPAPLVKPTPCEERSES
jgi:predicted transcriptional regulator